MTRRKLPISLTLIVKNEEKHLAACLESVKNFVSEIIIADTGSTDRTKEIAHAYGATVFDHVWNDDFAEARNAVLDRATYPWILQLDADEEIFQEDIDWFYNSYPWAGNEGYWLYIYNVNDRRPAMDAHPLIRFFKNHPHNRYKYRIHENLMLRTRAARVSNVRILHKGYATAEDDARKAKRNLALIKKRLAEEPDDPLSHYYFAQFYAGNQDFIRAGAPARKSLKLGLKMPIKAMALRIGFIAALKENRSDRFQEILGYAPPVSEFPDLKLYEALYQENKNPDVYFGKLNDYLALVDIEFSKGNFGKVDSIAPDNYTIALFRRSKIYEQNQLWELALQDFDNALVYSNPHFERVMHRIKLLIACGRLEEAKSDMVKATDFVEKLPGDNGQLIQKYQVLAQKLGAVHLEVQKNQA